MKKIIYVLLAIILIYFISLSFINFKTKTTLENKIQKLNNTTSQYQVQLTSYDRHIFTSSANIKIINNNTSYSPTPYKIPSELNITISHGPIIFDKGITFGLTNIKSNILFENIIKERIYTFLSKSLENQTFANVEYSKGFFNTQATIGIIKNSISSNNFTLDYDDINIIANDIKYFQAKNIDIQVNNIQINDTNQTIKINDINTKINLDYKYSSKYITNIDLNIKNINIDTQAIKDTFTVQGTLRSNELNLPQINFMSDIQIRSLTQKQKLDLSIDINNLNLEYLLKIDKLNNEQDNLVNELYVTDDKNQTLDKLQINANNILKALNKTFTTNQSNMDIKAYYIDNDGIFSTNTVLTYKIDSLGQNTKEFIKLKERPYLFWDLFEFYTNSALDKSLVLKHKKLQELIVGLQEYNLTDENESVFFINDMIDKSMFNTQVD